MYKYSLYVVLGDEEGFDIGCFAIQDVKEFGEVRYCSDEIIDLLGDVVNGINTGKLSDMDFIFVVDEFNGEIVYGRN